jgi:hypothetical protein
VSSMIGIAPTKLHRPKSPVREEEGRKEEVNARRITVVTGPLRYRPFARRRDWSTGPTPLASSAPSTKRFATLHQTELARK